MSTGKYFTYKLPYLIIWKNINIHIWLNSSFLLPRCLFCKPQPRPGVSWLTCTKLIKYRHHWLKKKEREKKCISSVNTTLWTNMGSKTKAHRGDRGIFNREAYEKPHHTGVKRKHPRKEWTFSTGRFCSQTGGWGQIPAPPLRHSPCEMEIVAPCRTVAGYMR